MNKEEFIGIISENAKLIRIEKGYTQEKMAEIVGISKKTLVQIEKGRLSMGWTNSVALSALFRDSGVLQSAIGGDPLEIVETLAYEKVERQKEKTLGGLIWWREVAESRGLRIQQNIISKHYRILDHEDYRLYSSFEHEDAISRFKTLTEEEKLDD
ncbi:helix-turn-helix transcriptional regulator [Peribacillus sp. SCS-37]|uniref:helix-turn-helix transcriptional regulator n=1 Tax=Paraperibacillus esterisolvens TaxID=3115296 RepID=UPI00390637FD